MSELGICFTGKRDRLVLLLRCCIDYQGVFKRIDLAVNDMGGLLDIEILRERYYANKVWKRSRTHEAVDSGKLSGTHGDTAKPFISVQRIVPSTFACMKKKRNKKQRYKNKH